METISKTPRDKFLELRKSWKDAVTARKQAYGDIIPPVWTPATPSTPPVQNPPVVPPQQTTPSVDYWITMEESIAKAKAYNEAQVQKWVAWTVLFDKSGTRLIDTVTSTSTPWMVQKTGVPNTMSTTTNWTDANWVTNPNSQWNQSTITWGGYGTLGGGKNPTSKIEWITNKVTNDAIEWYTQNKAIDYNQYKNQIEAANVKAAETEAEAKRFQLEKEQVALEEDRVQKEKAAKDAANLQSLQEKERAANEASVAAAQAKADAAERELQIANDIELQKSNVAFAKLWLTLSSAAVTQAQQIYTTWVYNLSKLKSENAFKLADLQVAVAQVEFEHTKAINDIINNSSEKSYEIRKKLNEDIHAIKNSIIDNRFERQKNIDNAIDTYQEAIKTNEEDTLDKINKANDVLNKNVDGFYARLKTQETYTNEKINTLVASGKWYAMSPIARSQYEKRAWLPTGTIARQIRWTVASKIYTQAKSITGLKWVTFSLLDYNNMIADAMSMVENMNTPMDEAINRVVSEYIEWSPEYKAALAKARKEWMIKSWGWSSGAQYWTSQSKEVYINGELKTVQYIPWTKGNAWKYVDNNWNPINGTIEDIWENTTSSKTSTADAIRAAIKARKNTTK